ncbi:hypothetical protein BDF20DRAFT_915170 [Mycotypha africana]|uniref:uncharacterized protein n=1 Tax=Mycotypha africana TaxID=64632 RepID=UPI0022FFF38A|nr:uncharacterized protein BDF20DRAFT_915170 [Mycotypha africana]KAI8973766.1 hypothetical protein BDF20DRAFT_915170 [Mycotypha africana]
MPNSSNLFQLAQVVTDFPMHRPQPSSSPLPRLRTNDVQHQQQQYGGLLPRKYYGGSCQCSEIQPRRGKNLPQGGLDSRAKRLMPQDKDDYNFTLRWLNEFANDIYRDSNRKIVNLDELMEVSLCKAHSSTLYRARKKYERNNLPLSPADSTNNNSSSSSNMEDIVMRDYHPQQYPYSSPPTSSSNASSVIYDGNSMNHVQVVRGGVLAAKVRELSCQQQQQQQQRGRQYNHNKNISDPDLPDFTMLSTSNSYKRKRTITNKNSLVLNQTPNCSISTPLLYSYQHQHTPQPYHHVLHHEPVQHQLPPLAKVSSPPPPNVSSSLHLLAGNFQHSLQVSTPSTTIPATIQSNKPSIIVPPPSPSLSTYNIKASPPPLLSANTISNVPLSNQNTSATIIETVSLKATNSDNDVIYYVRNLAITDTYTFNDLLCEIDFIGSPPPGKRIIISSDKQQTKVFPLGQAIRSVIKYPTGPHIDLYLGLADKTTIDWSSFQ